MKIVKRFNSHALTVVKSTGATIFKQEALIDILANSDFPDPFLLFPYPLFATLSLSPLHLKSKRPTFDLLHPVSAFVSACGF